MTLGIGMGKRMNPAGKLEMIMNLYSSGILCNCNEYEEREHPDDYEFREKVLIHKDDCTGKDKVKELLGFEE